MPCLQWTSNKIHWNHDHDLKTEAMKTASYYVSSDFALPTPENSHSMSSIPSRLSSSSSQPLSTPVVAYPMTTDHCDSQSGHFGWYCPKQVQHKNLAVLFISKDRARTHAAICKQSLGVYSFIFGLDSTWKLSKDTSTPKNQIAQQKRNPRAKEKPNSLMTDHIWVTDVIWMEYICEWIETVGCLDPIWIWIRNTVSPNVVVVRSILAKWLRWIEKCHSILDGGRRFAEPNHQIVDTLTMVNQNISIHTKNNTKTLPLITHPDKRWQNWFVVPQITIHIWSIVRRKSI